MATDTTPAPPVASEPKLSPVEGIKDRSRYLRGTLAEEVASPADHLSEEAKNILKFHGSYQQEDRDARKNRAKAGVGKAYMFMIRLKLPGGRLTADQYLAMDDICQRHGNGTLRFTTRQSIQFHGVLKAHLRQTFADINSVMVSTVCLVNMSPSDTRKREISSSGCSGGHTVSQRASLPIGASVCTLKPSLLT